MAKVLLVDDDVDIQEQNKAAFEAKGHAVTQAFTGKEAAAAIENDRPDGVVLDVMMETVDAGFEAARNIQKAHPGIPVLMLTAVNDKSGMPFKFEPDPDWNPVTKFLEKPVKAATIVAELEALLAREQ